MIPVEFSESPAQLPDPRAPVGSVKVRGTAPPCATTKYEYGWTALTLAAGRANGSVAGAYPPVVKWIDGFGIKSVFCGQDPPLLQALFVYAAPPLPMLLLRIGAGAGELPVA